MKRNRILLSAFAVVFSLSMALATNVSQMSEAWFQQDALGNPIGARLDGPPKCEQVEEAPFCAARFVVDENDNPVGPPLPGSQRYGIIE